MPRSGWLKAGDLSRLSRSQAVPGRARDPDPASPGLSDDDVARGVIAYNPGNLLRGLVLPLAIQSWSLASLRQRLFKTGGRLLRHARYFILQLAESHLTRRLFGQILGRIERLAWPPPDREPQIRSEKDFRQRRWEDHRGNRGTVSSVNANEEGGSGSMSEIPVLNCLQ
ncbi:MAG: transposase [Candidatus Rokubacteria bacterium]|nr:transposase [Candidatus Rokubacteria bacterium]